MAFETRAREAAVIGDNFMLPEKFEQAIRDAFEEALEIRTMCLPFPDESMEHGKLASKNIKVLRMKLSSSSAKPNCW